MLVKLSQKYIERFIHSPFLFVFMETPVFTKNMYDLEAGLHLSSACDVIKRTPGIWNYNSQDLRMATDLVSLANVTRHFQTRGTFS